MTTTVQSQSSSKTTTDPLSLKESVEADREVARRRPKIKLPLHKERRYECFCVLDDNVVRPAEFNRGEQRRIKTSAIHLPANTASLSAIKRAFGLYAKECSIKELYIAYFNGKACCIVLETDSPLNPPVSHEPRNH